MEIECACISGGEGGAEGWWPPLFLDLRETREIAAASDAHFAPPGGIWQRKGTSSEIPLWGWEMEEAGVEVF